MNDFPARQVDRPARLRKGDLTEKTLDELEELTCDLLVIQSEAEDDGNEGRALRAAMLRAAIWNARDIIQCRRKQMDKGQP